MAILRAAAEAIRERVHFLGAVVALEVGKNRVESVGEVEEAADLIDEYCRQLVEHERLRDRVRSAAAGETNTSVLSPTGSSA